MFDLNCLSNKLEALLKDRGVGEFAFTLSETEKRELNTEGVDYTLYRTIFGGNMALTVIIDGRKGTSASNDLSDTGLEALAADACLSAQSAESDPANAIAEAQSPETFHQGVEEPDMPAFCDELTAFMAEISKSFPKISILQLIGDHEKSHTLYVNSNGTRFDSYAGCYHITLEMSATDGEYNTGLDYLSLSTNDLKTPIMDQGGIRLHLADTEKSLNRAAIPDKFTGPIIFTPGCAIEFIYMLAANYMMSGVIMNGTSRWLDKVGEAVASPLLTLTLKAEDERLAECAPFTGDGYRAENVTLIENGVLKSHILDLYASRKTGRPVTKNSAFDIVMNPGDKSLQDMIASIDRGLIVGGFSGGEPGANGEFSGVAKNSFYVENGKIVGAVTETMISGNLEDLFRGISAISREQVSDGSFIMSWVKAGDVVVSGK